MADEEARPVARRQPHELFGPGSKEWSGVDEQRADLSLGQRGKCVIEFAFVAGVHNVQRKPELVSNCFQLFGYAISCLGSIGQQADDVGRRH